MKKEKKGRTLDERSSRLVMYLSLLAGAVFFAFYDPSSLWLCFGLGAGILYGIANDWIFPRRKKEQPPEVSTEKPETVENKTEEQGTTHHQQ